MTTPQMHLMPINAAQCVRKTIKDCLSGDFVEVAGKDSTYEKMYYSTGLLDPASRIFDHPARRFNPVVALARFTWLIAGNNRLEDIAYYEPKVRGFSDDGLTVPGSDYGMRLVQPRPGLNQLEGVADRLKADKGSRQAAAVVWQPEDAVRESRDIPCTFGMFFHVRRGHLDMCVNMRSNNAFRILPLNLFEFTMLHELMAREIDVPLGTYHLWAASMHVYKNEKEWDAALSVAHQKSELSEAVTMDLMPSRVPGHFRPLIKANQLAQYEAQLRHSFSSYDLERICKEARDDLDDYWFGLFAVLLCWSQAKHGADPFYHEVPHYLRDLTTVACQRIA